MLNSENISKEEIDELIEELSAILENNDSQKDMKRAEELRKEINCKKALLEII